ncbi:SDR family oxidoreductase [Corallincola spongiicola]|uniref:Dihydromonapterin reductase n=1 Tax=Corallincola spongiicola TaxID=2520508 RepID=A0ABY1WR17_9GAMM|nr:SDR family oxidoreductase [Corallincola spongiicola]TAA47157.1 SDR family oxidoreductase [Corallincola spongiicola]
MINPSINSKQSNPPVALVTGCGRRLGLFIAKQLLQQGYRVLGHYRSRSAELEQLERDGAELFQADFTQPAQISALSEWVNARCSMLSLLLHNASSFAETACTAKEMATQFTEFYHVHMLAPALLTEQLKALLVKADNPSIVAITDIYIHHPNPALATYCATKAGLDNLCQSYARSLAPQIRVNTIEPGPIMFLDSHDDEYKQRILAKTPLAQEGGFEPIWQALAMLIANRYMTGSRIQVDGGRSVAEL